MTFECAEFVFRDTEWTSARVARVFAAEQVFCLSEKPFVIHGGEAVFPFIRHKVV